MRKVLAISSAGGHWDQLMLLRNSFSDFAVTYCTTKEGLSDRYGITDCFIVDDCNQKTPLNLLRSFMKISSIIRSESPDIIVSTGAAPGLLAMVLGKLYGSKTIWIDSVANAEKLSLSGKLAGYICDVWLTQWEHLEKPNGPKYIVRVL